MLELFRAGGPVMYPLLACSVVAVAVIFERGIFWWRVLSGRDDVAGRVLAAADEGPRAEAPRRLRLAAEREAAGLQRYLSVLNTMVSLAPLLGIFGTVLGIMDSFRVLDSTMPETARQGLAQALLTTAFGLAIAMVSLIAYKVFHGRVVRLRHEIEIRSTELEIARGLAAPEETEDAEDASFAPTA